MPQKWGHTWFEIVEVVFHLLCLNHRHNKATNQTTFPLVAHPLLYTCGIVQINGEVGDGLKAGFQPLLYLYKYIFK